MGEIKLIPYKWWGVDHLGRLHHGKIYALNSQSVESQLKTQGMQEFIINKIALLEVFRKNTLKYSQLTSLLHELLILTKTGVNLMEALALLENNCDQPLLLALLKNIRCEIAGGQRLSQALKIYRQYFGDMVCELIEVGEQTGTLEGILNHLVAYREKVQELKKKLIHAMIYPAIVMSFTFLLVLIMVFAVIPRFAHLYQSFSVSLPWFTRLLLEGTSWLKHNFLYLVLSSLFFVWQIVQLRTSKSVSNYCYKIKLKIPWLKQLLIASMLSQSLLMLSMLLRTGTSLVQALEMLVKTATNTHFRIIWQEVLENLLTGQTFSGSLIRNGLFPHRLHTMVRLGEESGTLDQSLQSLADYYQQQVDSKLQQFEKLLEPFLMVLLAGIVGSLLIAMYLPIFRMGSIL